MWKNPFRFIVYILDFSRLLWYNMHKKFLRRTKRRKEAVMADISEAAKEERRAYKREWSAKNKDRVRAYNRAYWERRAQRLKAQAGAQDNVKKDDQKETGGTEK